MKIAFFDTHRFERPFFESHAARLGHEIQFLEPKLNEATAKLAAGFPAICAFVNDRLDAPTLRALQASGVRLIALRSAGYNHVDLPAAKSLGIPVVRVPAYSPYAVAEHTMGLALSLNRKIHRAAQRVHELNFALDGLVGFDFHGKTVGVVGLGKIGRAFARIVLGFGCQVLGYDVSPKSELEGLPGFRRAELNELFALSDVISLHVPLTPETKHLIDEAAIAKMKSGVMLLNTGRGGLIETKALIRGLKSGKIGSAGLDVYEEEERVFFNDLSETGIEDDLLARLLTFPNVLITAHQAFLTREALDAIARTTLESVTAFEKGLPLQNAVN